MRSAVFIITVNPFGGGLGEALVPQKGGLGGLLPKVRIPNSTRRNLLNGINHSTN